MAYPQNARVPVADRYWINGCNSLVYPTDIVQGAYYWSENLINRGGLMATRPGRELIFALPGNVGQGLTIYRPYRQKEQLVWAVDGAVYYSIYPFTTYAQVPNIAFYRYSPKVFFQAARQAVQQAPDGTLSILPTPVDILFMQDGFTASAFYIGASSTQPSQSRHNRASVPFNEAPVGTVMASAGARLWIANQETIFASDLDNPNSFTEDVYLAEADGFKLPEPATGMLVTPAQDALLAFTPFTITTLQAFIFDRSLWQQTPNFQQITSADYGAVSPFGIANQFGLPWFYSEVGLVNLDQAFKQYRSSEVNPLDGEMTRSKSNMSPVRNGIAMVNFENWLLTAVPSGSRFNRHVWVMDGSPQAQLTSNANPCWTGIWTGTFPIQFATAEVQDVPRCFELSYSCNPITLPNGTVSHIQIWEDFVGRRTDYNQTPIACSFESKIFEVSQTGELARFKYAELDLVEIVGQVFIQIYYAGIKAHYRKAYELMLDSEEGLPGNPNYPILSYANLATDTVMETFRPQTRTIRTPEFGGASAEADPCSDTCGIESNYQHDVDKGFQLLINWQGRMAIRELRLFVEPFAQPGIGQCTPTEVGKTNIVSAIGCLPPPTVCMIPVPLP